MVSSEVQRTLVKSPPELWAELSDPASLSRHLGELGEIRITRIEHERRVEWESDGLTGAVLIKPSGWGTKVTLTVTREQPEIAESLDHATAPPPPLSASARALQDPEPPSGEAEPQGERSGEAFGDPAADPAYGWAQDEPESEAPGEAPEDPAAEPAYAWAHDEPEAEEAQPAPERESRRGFFERLFGRWRARVSPAQEGLPQEPEQLEDPHETPEHGHHVESPDEDMQATIVFEAVRPEPSSAPEDLPDPTVLEADRPASAIDSLQARFIGPEPTAPEPTGEPPAQPAPSQVPDDLSTELRVAEEVSAQEVAAQEVSAEQVTAVLSAVLDRLGAAHHRPFSRS